MTQERRNYERITKRIPVRWEGLTGRHEARLEDLSLGGCFVTTSSRMDLDEIIALEIRKSSGDWLPLRGQVISYQPAVGFGVEFDSLTEEEESTLNEIMNG
jgi:hypothetical protein